MRYLALRHNPATSLVGMLCLAASLFLAVAASPTSAALPAQLTSQEKINFELAIKSDEELTTTITITSPASREKNLKEDCVQETFSQAATPPDITFTNDNGTPTCKATYTTTVSRNSYVTHDGDEYVVDTHDDSAPKDGSADTFSLTVVFPGKVTESGGGKVEGDQQNKVSFSSFYNQKARGKDTAQAASQPSSTPSPSSTPASSSASSSSSTATPGSTSSSQSSGGRGAIIVTLIVIAVVGGVVAIVSNTLKNSREKKYLDALGQQSLQASTLMPTSHPAAFPSPAQAGPPPAQPGYSPAPQQYQPPHSQGPAPAPQFPPNHNGYGRRSSDLLLRLRLGWASIRSHDDSPDSRSGSTQPTTRTSEKDRPWKGPSLPGCPSTHHNGHHAGSTAAGPRWTRSRKLSIALYSASWARRRRAAAIADAAPSRHPMSE